MTNRVPLIYADELGKYKVSTNETFVPHGQGQSGYGAKITTHHVLTFENEKRYRRIYAICFSNCASHFIVMKGERVFIRYFD